MNKPITRTTAEKRGLRPLAGPFSEAEEWMIESLCADLRRGGIAHAVVDNLKSFEVWRTGIGWREIKKNGTRLV